MVCRNANTKTQSAWRKRGPCLVGACILFVLLALSGCALIARPLEAASVGAGYKAKVLASGVFVSRRDPDEIVREDFAHIPQMKWLSHKIDRDEGAVEVSFLGLIRRKAIYREGLGCTIVRRDLEAQVRAQRYDLVEPEPRDPDDVPWPTGDRRAEDAEVVGLDRDAVACVVEGAFAEPDPNCPRRTKAVVVVYDGRIVAERYAPGTTADTALPGWSMTKSVQNALVGILVMQGRLSVDDPAPVRQWQQPGDPRAAITLDQLLRMTSGLEFGEFYREFPSDVNTSLFVDPDAAGFAARKSLIAEPGSQWAYSSGSTNIVSHLVRQVLADDQAEYFAFPRRALFNRIGMRSAVLEPDAAGDFVASSFMYATARDWARFGLLYLQDGVWEDRRILPEGWVAYTCTPTPAAPNYGASFWLNVRDGNGRKVFSESLPDDLFMARGYGGQVVAIVPSRKLVAVHLGQSPEHDWGLERFMIDLLKAIPRDARAGTDESGA